MFQTFTGSSRRPRQVNLSGTTANPFAKVGTGAGSQAALANAHQERAQRQRERERLNAARTIQRTWRGYACRKEFRQTARHRWDRVEEEDKVHLNATARNAPGWPCGAPPYPSDAKALSQVSSLLRFATVRSRDDLDRVRLCVTRLLVTIKSGNSISQGASWSEMYLGVIRFVIEALQSRQGSWSENEAVIGFFFDAIPYLVERTSFQRSRDALSYYSLMARFTRQALSKDAPKHSTPVTLPRIVHAIVAPLRKMDENTVMVYRSFLAKYLTIPEFSQEENRCRLAEQLAENINPIVLARVLSELFESNTAEMLLHDAGPVGRLSLLGCFIYFHRHAHGFSDNSLYTSDPDFVSIVAALLSSLADEVEFEKLSDYTDLTGNERHRRIPMNSFVRDQISSLLSQHSVGSLFSGISRSRRFEEQNKSARQMASYALTLLQCFPRRGDEIRLWLYLGASSGASADGNDKNASAIRYFSSAMQSTDVFKTISRDSRKAIDLLKPIAIAGKDGWSPPNIILQAQGNVNDDWRVILIFFELYTFVLKVMDDAEFFSGGSDSAVERGLAPVRNNALPLEDVKNLTTFLRNFGFTLYYNASDIMDARSRDVDHGGFSSYFRISSGTTAAPQHDTVESKPSALAGVPGLGLDYLKGLVTGLLRMIYERDSRQTFIPKGHWLMTSRFDMESFIPGVVEEEENRHRVQEEDDLDVDQDEEDVEDYDRTLPILAGMSRLQQQRRHEQLRRQQRKASRKRYLQSVAPRLEILQNLPFFTPFHTRVQIFRKFVERDQLKRRQGAIDPDIWRFQMINGPHQRDLERHHAKIRREHEFEDAFEQFYPLKDGLKEPISITFVDKFDQQEAGIDGGGVTKEFLTSVTSQAFTPVGDEDLFIENDQHLLYPNPSAVDQQSERMRQAGLRESHREWKEAMTNLLQRYEFLGRVIGKCLYEGILVDINFAPFFLLKWALTGGSGSSPKESGYRANINDLRDLDRGLYDGLLQLKNYTGNVEDFALNFTITDTIFEDKTATRDLKPNGSNIPVTNENRLVYISYVARHRLVQQPYRQSTAFLRGLSSMIEPSWLSMFNQSELQTLVSGTSASIDVSDLRGHTQYGGLYVIGDDGLEHPTVQLFWAVVSSFTDEEKRQLLKFVTSTPRAPLLGFASLNPKFSIRDSGTDETRLPSTSTCVNLLKLPRYSSAATLKEKLLYAINSGAGFDLS